MGSKHHLLASNGLLILYEGDVWAFDVGLWRAEVGALGGFDAVFSFDF